MSDTTTRSTPTVTPPGKKPVGALSGSPPPAPYPIWLPSPPPPTAKQTDGSVKTYAGTDTVANGVIVAAHITQTGGPAA